MVSVLQLSDAYVGRAEEERNGGGGRGPDGAMAPDFYIGVVGMGPDEAMVLDRYLLVWGQGSWWGCDTTSLYGVVHPIRKLVLQDNHGLGGWRYPIQEFHSS